MNTFLQSSVSAARRCKRPSIIVPALTFTLALAALGQVPAKAPLVPKPRPAPAAPSLPATPHQMDSADIGAFLDGVMPITLQRDNIAGAVVSIVKDGKVIFAKGYGYADVKTKKPVSPADTLFRPGSISKLFTWTAVMQQVQQGKLNLDTDINQYLDFKVPEKYGKPITLRNIMTHTSGFSETVKDLFLANPKDLTSLRSYLIDHMPARVYPPGTTPSYSNYATALAGYIVQRASGEPYDQYIEEHIFTPLDMHHATFRQPLPDNLKDSMSSGYKLASEKAKDFEIVQVWPAGSSSISAIDMTHFMIAQLQNGEYNGAQILQPDTVKMMHTRQALPAGDALNAMCLGFYEESLNGHRIIGHGGDTVYFHSDLHLMQDANLGFFVSYNSAGNGTIDGRSTLWHAFLDRYFPYSVATPPAIASAAADAKALTGGYMVSRRIQGNFMYASSLPGEAKLSSKPDGTITVEELKGFDKEPIQFREIAPKVYQNIDGQEKLAFYQGYDGRTTFGIDYPFMVFQRVGLLQSKGFNYVVLFGSLAIMVIALLLWPIAAWVRRHYGRSLVISPGERRLRVLTRLVCVVDIIVVIGFVTILSKLDDITVLNGRLDVWVHLLQVLGVIGVIGAILAIYNAVRVWRSAKVESPARVTAASVPGGAAPVAATTMIVSRRRGAWSAWGATVIAIACIGFAWFLLYWGVLNFNLNY
ncbi:MAG: serine hydrolase domain-containing protein [Acidobacteriaceae bacterium]